MDRVFEVQHERVISGRLDAVWTDLARSALLPEAAPPWKVRVEPRDDGIQHERYSSNPSSRIYQRELYSGDKGVLAVREVIAATASGDSTVVRTSVSTIDASLTVDLASVFQTAIDALEPQKRSRRHAIARRLQDGRDRRVT